MTTSTPRLKSTDTSPRHPFPPCSILDQAVSAVDAWVAADHLAMHGQRESDDGGSTSSAALAAMPPNAFAVTLFCLESRWAACGVWWGQQ